MLELLEQLLLLEVAIGGFIYPGAAPRLEVGDRVCIDTCGITIVACIEPAMCLDVCSSDLTSRKRWTSALGTSCLKNKYPSFAARARNAMGSASRGVESRNPTMVAGVYVIVVLLYVMCGL